MKLMPTRPMPRRRAVVPPSGTEELAEKENLPPAAIFWVEKFHAPAASSNPLPDTQPVPVTEIEVAEWNSTAELTSLKVNPLTLQNASIAPELNYHGGVKVTLSPAETI